MFRASKIVDFLRRLSEWKELNTTALTFYCNEGQRTPTFNNTNSGLNNFINFSVLFHPTGLFCTCNFCPFKVPFFSKAHELSANLMHFQKLVTTPLLSFKRSILHNMHTPHTHISRDLYWKKRRRLLLWTTDTFRSIWTSYLWILLLLLQSTLFQVVSIDSLSCRLNVRISGLFFFVSLSLSIRQMSRG